MKLSKYQLKAEIELTVFRFVSEGPKGKVPKLIEFTETNLKDFYNLAFGDKDEETGRINDIIVTNNGVVRNIKMTMRSILFFLLGFFIFSCNSKNSVMTEEEFAKVYLDSLSKKYPTVNFQLNSDLSITSKKDSSDYRHYIDNAFIAYKADPDSVNSIISRYVASTTELYIDQKVVDVKNIVPVIKPIEYLDEINSLNKNGKLFPMATEKYNAQLIIAYAEDSKNSIKYLTEDSFKTLSISKDTLKSIALICRY